MGFREPAFSRVNPLLHNGLGPCAHTREYGSSGDGGLPVDIGQDRHTHK